MASEFKIDITSESNEYLRQLASQLVEEIRRGQLSNQKKFLTLQEIYNDYNCSRNTVNQWFENYGLQKVVVGRKIYVDVEDLNEMFIKLKN